MNTIVSGLGTAIPSATPQVQPSAKMMTVFWIGLLGLVGFGVWQMAKK